MKTILLKLERKFFAAFVIANMFFVNSSRAQLTSGSTYTIDNTASGAMLFPTGTYFSSFTTAVTALNATSSGTISSTVTFNVVAGQTFNEFPLKITYANSNASNPNILFQKSGAGNNPLVQGTNGMGNSDTILVIRKGDYYIIDGINFKDNAANTTAATEMECGIALRASSTDGCRNNIIKNCTVTLNKINTNNTVCIYTDADNAGTTAAGTNNNNTFTSNTLLNAMNGYVLAGRNTSFPDVGNIINKSSGRSYISDIGPSTVNSSIGIYQGINLIAQKNFSVTNTCIENITHYDNAGNAGSIYGIQVGDNTLDGTISGDTIQNCSVAAGSTGSANIFGYYVNNAAATIASTITFDNNLVKNLNGSVAAGSNVFGINTAPVLNTVSLNVISNNVFTNFNCNTSANGTAQGININAGTFEIAGNTISSITAASDGASGVNCAGPTAGITQLHDNTVTDLSATGGTVDGLTISSFGAGANTLSIYNNTLHSFSGVSAVIGIAAQLSGTTYTIYNNRIYDLSSTSSTGTVITGMTVVAPAAGTSNLIYNNMIYDLRGDAATSATNGGGVKGITLSNITSAGSSMKIYYNTIYLNSTSNSATHTSSCLYIGASPSTVADAYDIRNNILDNRYDVTSGTRAVAFWYNDSTSYIGINPASNNNLVFAGIPSIKNLLFYDRAHAAQALGTPNTGGTYKYFLSVNNTLPRETNSVTGDPVFVNPNGSIDVHIQPAGSPAAGAGVTVTGYTVDIDGDTRGNPPCIGADELNNGCVVAAGTITAVADTICANATAQLSLAGNSAGAIQWQSGTTAGIFSSISGATNTTYSTPPLAQTTYYYVIVGSGNCVDTTLAFVITTVTPPVAAYSNTIAGQVVSFNSGATTGATAYNWSFGDGGTSTLPNPVHTYAAAGTYHVCLTASIGGCSDSVCHEIVVEDGGNSIANLASQQWKIYPNPVADYFFIEGAVSNLSSVEVDDLLGRVWIKTNAETFAGSKIKIDASELPVGIYFLKIKTADKEYRYSIIKQ